jgi:hypothetical protein
MLACQKGQEWSLFSCKRLRAIQKRFARLKTQTKIYEKGKLYSPGHHWSNDAAQR